MVEKDADKTRQKGQLVGVPTSDLGVVNGCGVKNTIAREDYIASNSFSVSNLLNNKKILLVGANTYVGKMFLKSVLTNVDNISTIKVLIDAPSFEAANEVFRQEILADNLFNGLREKLLGLSDCAFSQKFECIPAQTEKTNLGLSAIGLGVLAESIDQIVNCGSAVNLPESFKQVLAKNTIANLNLIKLSKLNNIPVLHLSTVYVKQIRKGEISESLAIAPKNRCPKLSDGRPDIVALIAKYQSKINAIESLKLGRKCIEKKLLKLGVSEAKKLGFNDPYLLTRWMSEHLYAQELKDHNLTILRTSVIRSPLTHSKNLMAMQADESQVDESHVSESQLIKKAESNDAVKPDELRNIDRLMLAHATGRLKRLPVKKRSSIDFAPVDRIANSLILAMAEQQAVKKKPIDIYHCATGGTRVSRLIRTLNQSLISNRDQLTAEFRQEPISILKASHPWVYKIFNRLTPKAKKQPEVDRLAFYMNLNCTVSVSEALKLVERFQIQDQLRFPTVAKVNWLERIQKEHHLHLNRWLNKDQKGNSERVDSDSVEAVA